MDVEEYARIAAAEDTHWWYQNTRTLIANLLGPWLDQAPSAGPTKRILDAGCGPGGNGAWLDRHGTLVGVDLAGEALHFVRERRPDALTAQADVTHLPFANQRFDVVIGVTVLYAVPDDAAAVAEIRRVLRPGGVALLVEPAFPVLRRAHDRVVGGLRRFRRPGLVALMQRADLRVRRVCYVYSFLAPVAALLALADRLPWPGVSGAGTRSDIERRSLDGVFSKFAATEARWLTRGRGVPFGTSVVIVATRDE